MTNRKNLNKQKTCQIEVGAKINSLLAKRKFCQIKAVNFQSLKNSSQSSGAAVNHQIELPSNQIEDQQRT